MRDLITGLLELARGDAQSASARPVQLDELVESAVERARARFPSVQLDEQLEPTTRRRRARAARARGLEPARERRQVERAGGAVEVALASGELTVRDHGPGIAAEDREHVFDRFYRATAARSLPGSGLGLAIVREVAEAHGGTCRPRRRRAAARCFGSAWRSLRAVSSRLPDSSTAATLPTVRRLALRLPCDSGRRAPSSDRTSDGGGARSRATRCPRRVRLVDPSSHGSTSTAAAPDHGQRLRLGLLVRLARQRRARRPTARAAEAPRRTARAQRLGREEATAGGDEARARGKPLGERDDGERGGHQRDDRARSEMRDAGDHRDGDDQRGLGGEPQHDAGDLRPRALVRSASPTPALRHRRRAERAERPEVVAQRVGVAAEDLDRLERAQRRVELRGVAVERVERERGRPPGRSPGRRSAGLRSAAAGRRRVGRRPGVGAHGDSMRIQRTSESSWGNSGRRSVSLSHGVVRPQAGRRRGSARRARSRRGPGPRSSGS